MKVLRHRLFRLAASVALGSVLLYASYDKILNPKDFARIVYHYQLIGPNATVGYIPANALAVVLPWVEVVTGICLVFGLWRREAALLSASMMAVFIVAVGWALLHGIDLENCGCFSVGPEGRRAGWRLLAGDTVLLALSLGLVLVRPADQSS